MHLVAFSHSFFLFCLCKLVAHFLVSSILGRTGFCSRAAALEYRLERPNAEEGKDWYCSCHESWCIVSFPNALHNCKPF